MFRYDPPPAEFFASNRHRFMRAMQPGTMAVFFAAQRINANADGEYPFIQDSNFYYLTGIDQEDCILILCPDAPVRALQEILLVRPTSEYIQIWEGWKYSPEEAAAASGIREIRYLEAFESTLQSLVSIVNGTYIDINEHSRNSGVTYSPAHRFARQMREQFPAHELYRAAPLLTKQRILKSPEEAAQIRRAAGITREAFLRVLEETKPGMKEYQIEGIIRGAFIAGGGMGPAYEPIVASGANACVLHYTRNCQQLGDGELMLMDFGCDYGHYSSDLSRTIPTNGRYTERQKQLYSAVRRVQKNALAQMKPGTSFQQYNTDVAMDMQEELLSLGLITKEEVANQDPKKPAYKKYFPHGVSHHMGLDTHDVGSFHITLEPGMVFTVEPGIYVREEGIGIRLENDVMITEDGHEDFMAGTPIEIEEIESRMNA